MYFGVARENPKLATRVFTAVLGHALHPATVVAPMHTPWVNAQVYADLSFSVADDQCAPWNGEGMPRLGYYGSLLGPDCRVDTLATGQVVIQDLRESHRSRSDRPGGGPD
ncbi:hypothetical protein GA0074692_0657 [Micromonospora pallida]|uniref:Uncharacterized protein n=1 Tax=Micromonospora pallida TaxID=145854 RepID=A0A1C6RQV1_9ACTN|nr:hypothetical protein [Micromonospora pallida]SCL19582.1 hypothetical protein GA0074692_0657 [Micromonospora pallida]